jgi:hypothetical protein
MNQPIPWSGSLLQKLTVTQLVKKFPIFYGTRRFITTFTRAGHRSLSRLKCIQSRAREHISHPYKTIGKITVLYILSSCF